MQLTASEIATAVGGTLHGPDVTVDGVSFDSRTLTPGQLFVAIEAERDGHDFVPASLARGAAAVLVRHPGDAPTAVVVDDTSAALVELGRHARSRLPDRVVGITGSVGKTSVKDLTAAVLRSRHRVTANERSFNNEQGLPVTLLSAPADVEVVVVEMGMRGPGEIARLAAVARPTIGVVTAIAEAHSERVGGLAGVVRAKQELVEALPSSGLAVLNADQPEVAGMAVATAARVLTFGEQRGDVRASDVTLDRLARPRFRLETPFGSAEVRLAVSGAHMVANACAAAAVGCELGVPVEGIAAALAGAVLSAWRMEVHELGNGGVVVNDAYNANPTSMRAALDALAAMPAARRIAVLGVMAEITDPEREHLAISDHARERGIRVVAVGTPLYGVEPVPAAGDVSLSVVAGDAVLVKGSRVAGLERVVASLLG